MTIIITAFQCATLFYYVAMPKIVERRAKDLNLMQYSGKKYKFTQRQFEY